jgi:hypothetical protein
MARPARKADQDSTSRRRFDRSLTESNTRAVASAEGTVATIPGNFAARRKINIAARKRFVMAGCEMARIKSRRTRNS